MTLRSRSWVIDFNRCTDKAQVRRATLSGDSSYFILLMSRSPEKQIDLLFSGSRGILNDEKDIIDGINIFLMLLIKMPSKTSIII